MCCIWICRSYESKVEGTNKNSTQRNIWLWSFITDGFDSTWLNTKCVSSELGMYSRVVIEIKSGLTRYKYNNVNVFKESDGKCTCRCTRCINRCLLVNKCEQSFGYAEPNHEGHISNNIMHKCLNYSWMLSKTKSTMYVCISSCKYLFAICAHISLNRLQ